MHNDFMLNVGLFGGNMDVDMHNEIGVGFKSSGSFPFVWTMFGLKVLLEALSTSAPLFTIYLLFFHYYVYTTYIHSYTSTTIFIRYL